MSRYQISRVNGRTEIVCPSGVTITTDRRVKEFFGFAFFVNDNCKPYSNSYIYHLKNKEDKITLKCIAKLNGYSRPIIGNYVVISPDLFSKTQFFVSFRDKTYIKNKISPIYLCEFISFDDVLEFISEQQIGWT